jgi:hypothetical protein
MTTGEFVRRLCKALGLEHTEDWQFILAQAEIAGNAHLFGELQRQLAAKVRDTRDDLIDEARECWVNAGLPVDGRDDDYLSDELTKGLHNAFPFLNALHTRLIESYRIDIEGRSDSGSEVDPLDVPASPQTVLASDAYVAAMRAVIHGHKLGKDIQ